MWVYPLSHFVTKIKTKAHRERKIFQKAPGPVTISIDHYFPFFQYGLTPAIRGRSNLVPIGGAPPARPPARPFFLKETSWDEVGVGPAEMLKERVAIIE